MLKRTHQSNGVRHSSTPVVGGLLALLLIRALSYVLILYPPLRYLDAGQNPAGLITPRVENKIFWPAKFAVSVFLLLINRSLVGRKAHSLGQGPAAPQAYAARFLNQVA